MKNLGRAEVPLMTHSDDNMWGSLMLEENWLRVSDSSVPGAQPVSYLTKLKSSQSSQDSEVIMAAIACKTQAWNKQSIYSILKVILYFEAVTW